MKTITLFFFIVFAMTTTSNAQITKSNWLVGGDGSYSVQKGEGTSNGITNVTKASGLILRSNIGYFVMDNLVLGLTPQFSFSNPEGPNNGGFGFGIGPLARYYFLKPEKKINIFSQISYFYGNGFSNGKKTSTSNGFLVKAGPAIFFNQSVALEVTLNYERSKNKYEAGSEAKFQNLNIGIGFQIHLEK